MSLGFNTNILYSGNLDTSFVTDPIYLGPNTRYTMHAVYSDASSPVGTLTVEVSIDGNTWALLADSSYSVSSTEGRLYQVSEASYLLARMRWVRSSGSGAVVVHATVKE